MAAEHIVPTQVTEAGIFKTMCEIVNFGSRLPGTKAEKDTAAYLMDQLKEAGVRDVTFEPYNIRCYEVEKQSLEVIAGNERYVIPCRPMWYGAGAQIQAEAVFMEYGLEAPSDWEKKVKGKIVFVKSKVMHTVSPSHDFLALIDIAVQAGALAFIVSIDTWGLDSRYVELFAFNPEPTIPALVLREEDGRMIESLIKSNKGKIEFKIDSRVRFYEDTTGDIWGVIPGTDDVLALITHYDSTNAGAMDNASGNAGWLAAAKDLAKLQEPHPTILFSAHSGHENFLGARNFAKAHRDLIKRAYTMINFDGLAVKGVVASENGIIPTNTDGHRVIHVSDNPFLLKLGVEAAKDFNLLPAIYNPLSAFVGSKDLEGQFYDANVPVLYIFAHDIWYHSSEDTIDKISSEQLYRSYLAHLYVIRRLLLADPREVKANDRKSNSEVLAAVIPDEIRDMKFGEAGMGVTFSIFPNPVRTGKNAMFAIGVPANPDEVVIKCEWDFGDGATSEKTIETHAYEKLGRYSAGLTLTDSGGRRSVYERPVWVIEDEEINAI
jgi:hypothetical protein